MDTYNQNQPETIDVLSRDMEQAQTRYMKKIYAWMALALAVTGVVAHFVASTPALIEAILLNKIMFFAIIGAELFLVIYLSARIHRMSFPMAMGSFMVYSILNGLTLSFIFLAYTSSSIASTFFITAGTFAVMSIYGYTTKTDLTKIGKILFMLLIGLIIATVVNIFMHSSTLYWIVSYAGVAIFVGLIAYDTQKIKRMFVKIGGDEEALKKIAILGALSLYLDFINLFLFLLRILGNRN